MANALAPATVLSPIQENKLITESLGAFLFCPVKWADHPCDRPSGSVGSYLDRVPYTKQFWSWRLLAYCIATSSKSVSLSEPLVLRLKEETSELGDM